jgi:trans-2,3-dihydro-3-hydroxyanthranilate isomerase
VSDDYILLDVFVDAAGGGGNALAVFPDAAEMPAERMQAHAAELNLSESAFVIRWDESSYDVRIFTPREELPFAGHPTLGTCWTLLHLDRLRGDRYTQDSAAGATDVWREGDVMWYSRSGKSSDDIDLTHPQIQDELADALGLEPRDIGLEAREIGRSGFLRPAFSSGGLEHFCVPLRDIATLGRIEVDPTRLAALSHEGAYCFTAERAGEVRARGFFPAYGIAEDPATGSGAASLGLYLAERLGDITFEVHQGIEMGNSSRLHVKATPMEAAVGGRCALRPT